MAPDSSATTNAAAALARIDLAAISRGATTRFAPAPTGFLHLGHVVNAVLVWGIARAIAGRVILRIEDHDRQRSRPEYEAALLEDLAWLGFIADDRPLRQSDDDSPYREALEHLRGEGLVYACDCTRSIFARWASDHGRSWSGRGCPGECRGRAVADGPATVVRLNLGDGEEAWTDLALGRRAGPVAMAGDLPARDRNGNWTYGLAVVVDDLRQGIDLVIRGEDLVDATPAQIRLGSLLGRPVPAAFLHHALILRPDGSKLSKAGRDTGVRDLRAAGWTPRQVLDAAAEHLR